MTSVSYQMKHGFTETFFNETKKNIRNVHILLNNEESTSSKLLGTLVMSFLCSCLKIKEVILERGVQAKNFLFLQQIHFIYDFAIFQDKGFSPYSSSPFT